MTSSSAGWPRLLRRQFEFVDQRIALVRLENLESLLRDVLPSREYPLEWVIFRMTGIDSDSEGRPASILGASLIPELVALAEDMSRTFGPLPFDRQRDLSVEESARRLGVSARTLRRWRPRGLPLLRFAGDDGGPRVGVRRAQLAWFAEIHRPDVERARRRRPVDTEEAESIRRRFEVVRGEVATDAAAIRTVARESRRSPSTVRRLIGADRPVGVSSVASRDRIGRLVLRGFDRAVPIEEIAVRAQRSVRSVRRRILEARWRRLSSLPDSKVVPAGVDRPDAGRVFGAAGQLDARCRDETRDSLATWLSRIRAGTTPDSEPIRERLAAMHFALWRARRGVEEQVADRRPPTAAGLDAIESDLRWWALLRERSVREGLASGLQRLEQSLGRSIEDLAVSRVLDLLDRLVLTTAVVVDGFDPERRVLEHSLDRACGLAVSRMMATLDPVPVSKAARSRGDLSALPAPDLLRSTPAPVRHLLGVERWWRVVGGEVESGPGEEACRLRHGLSTPGRPRSWRDVAQVLGRPASNLVTDATAFEHRLRRRALVGAGADAGGERF